MAAEHGDELICDFAEYYGIYDYRSLRLSYAAVLASGLPFGSRTMRALSGQRFGVGELLAARTLDMAALAVWMQTKDGRRNRNRPRSVAEAMSGRAAVKEARGFASGRDFDAARKRILEGM